MIIKQNILLHVIFQLIYYKNCDNGFDYSTGNLCSHSTSWTQQYQEVSGNIESKTGFGTNLEYGSKPHALVSFTPSSSALYGEEQSLEYTDFKKVKKIKQGIKSLSITYGVDQQRIFSEMRDALGTTQHYYIGNYEEINTGNTTQKLHFISGGSGLAGIYIENASGSGTFYSVYTDYKSSLIALADKNGTIVEDYAYDPWGLRRDPSGWVNRDTRNLLLDRGYTMHEHLPAFNLIDMNGRMYDPQAGLFLSPDPYVQSPDNWLNFNRYSYCLNNPLMYTDPSGEVFWVPIAAAAFIFGTGNLTAHAIRGDVNSFGDGLKYFGQGAVAGAALGAIWQFSGSFIHTILKTYVLVQGGFFGVGIIGGAVDSGWKGVGRALKIFNGNFYIDENKPFFGGVWEGISRHTYQIIQTSMGYAYTQSRSANGGDRVDYLGGATFLTKENQDDRGKNISLGNFINVNIKTRINKDFDEFVTDDPLYMHEYGHYIESQKLGPFYLIPGLESVRQTIMGTDFVKGTRNLTNADNSVVERRANRRAKKYFKKNYEVKWSKYDYPNDNYPLRKVE